MNPSIPLEDMKFTGLGDVTSLEQLKTRQEKISAHQVFLHDDEVSDELSGAGTTVTRSHPRANMK